MSPDRPPLHAVVKAAAIAPLAVIPAAVILLTLLSLLDGSLRGPVQTHLMTSVGVGAIGSVYAYLMMFAYGLPCYLILWRLGRGNWINTTVIALIPGLIYGIWFEFGKMILWYAWFALAVSGSCWLLLKRGDRPADQLR